MIRVVLFFLLLFSSNLAWADINKTDYEGNYDKILKNCDKKTEAYMNSLSLPDTSSRFPMVWHGKYQECISNNIFQQVEFIFSTFKNKEIKNVAGKTPITPAEFKKKYKEIEKEIFDLYESILFDNLGSIFSGFANPPEELIMENQIVKFKENILWYVVYVREMIIDHFDMGPSFDCSYASTWDEKAICNSKVLSKLDKYMGLAYRKALSDQEDDRATKTLQKSQREWLKSRSNRMLKKS